MDPENFLLVQRALAEPKRLEIIETIRNASVEDGVSCSTILAEMSISQATFSHHVAELIRAEVILGRKEGRFMKLTVNEPVVLAYLEALKTKMLGSL